MQHRKLWWLSSCLKIWDEGFSLNLLMIFCPSTKLWHLDLEIDPAEELRIVKNRTSYRNS